MARIRTIKPEFWDHKQLNRCSLLARLTFVGLINFADDDGRGRAEIAWLWGRMHSSQPPGVRQRFTRALSELRHLKDEDGPLVVFYKVAGAAYYCLTGFKRQQRIDKPSESKLPPPPNSKNVPRALTEDSALDQGSRIKEGIKEGKGGETPSITGGPLDHLFRVAVSQKIIGRPETIRNRLEGWNVRVGPAKTEEMLMACAGYSVIQIEDKYFPRNGKPGGPTPIKDAIEDWVKSDAEKGKTK